MPDVSTKSIFKLSMIIFSIAFLSLIVFASLYTQKKVNTSFLTDEEREWLDSHEGQIKIGYTTDYPPIEFLENGQYVGISADYFHLLEKKLDITIDMVEFEHWDELIAQAKRREISGITAATKTKERSAYFDFTVPYIMNPNVIITRQNFSEQLTFDKLADSTIELLVVKDYAITEYLKRDYPNINYVEVLSPNEGLRKVSLGEADAIIIEIMSASASITEDSLSNLVVNAETPFESNLSIATRNDWPILSDIFGKGLAQITESERQSIRSKWVLFEEKSIFETPYFGITLTFILLLLVFVLITVIMWNYTLKKAVNDKTLTLENYKNQLLKEIEERKKTEEIIKYRSYHDELTGLYNRAYFSEQFLHLNQAEHLPLSIIVADLNGLKITNDTFGHQTGDQIIIQIARILESVFQDDGIIARIGGDEFVILLPNTPKSLADNFCQQVKQACALAPKTPIQPSVALGFETKNDMTSDINMIFKQAEDKMYEDKLGEQGHISTTILESLEGLLRKTTNESSEHSQRLRNLALKLGRQLSLSRQDLNALSLLADLHDIGKLALSEELLQKKAPLTLDEWERIKKHSELGYKIATSLPELSQIATGILNHHERWDGAGYPQGLAKEDIPLLARIIALVDAYDVMTMGRPYKTPLSKSDAIKELKKCAGTQFDPALVKLFINEVL